MVQKLKINHLPVEIKVETKIKIYNIIYGGILSSNDNFLNLYYPRLILIMATKFKNRRYYRKAKQYRSLVKKYLAKKIDYYKFGQKFSKMFKRDQDSNFLNDSTSEKFSYLLYEIFDCWELGYDFFLELPEKYNVKFEEMLEFDKKKATFKQPYQTDYQKYKESFYKTIERIFIEMEEYFN